MTFIANIIPDKEVERITTNWTKEIEAPDWPLALDKALILARTYGQLIGLILKPNS